MLLLTVLFFVLMFMGMPIAFAIGLAGFSFFVLSDTIPLGIAVQQIASQSQSFPLLAVPFFVLAGHVMNKSGITQRLINCANVLVAWMTGGLAQVCILLSTMMGGISGSAVADAAMEARMLGPEMIRRGVIEKSHYDDAGLSPANIVKDKLLEQRNVLLHCSLELLFVPSEQGIYDEQMFSVRTMDRLGLFLNQ